MEIRAQFDVELPVHIVVTADFGQHDLADIRVEGENHRISLKVSETPRRWQEEGEPPEYTVDKVRVWVIRDFPDCQSLALSFGDVKRQFETDLKTTVAKFVKAVQSVTRQLGLDDRHPIKSFEYRYSWQDEALPELFPATQGTKYVSMSDVTGSTIFELESYDTLSSDSWHRLRQAMHEEAEDAIPRYEKRLYDARSFLHQLRFDAAILYAAFAVEELLASVCQALIERVQPTRFEWKLIVDGRRKGKQPPPIKDMKASELRRLSKLLVEKLAKETDATAEYPADDAIQDLFRLRNDIAHYRWRYPEKSDVIKAISIALSLKRAFESVR